MTVRLEELLAAFAREPTADSPLEDVLAWTGARQQVEKLAPEMARLLIDMGEWIRQCQGYVRDAIDQAPTDAVRAIPIADYQAAPALRARLDRLGAKDEENA